ncbi:MAG: histidine phosphatase family protein, partial [Spirochaetales bacterium]|nr:histidine phosphatase family protein [Spirochaetales bacterium]
DFSDPHWRETAENPYNPPLATVGFEQASETAERLKDEKIDHIIASPFLRTIQTANIIAEKLGKKVILETGLSEWLSLKDFDFRPILDDPYDLVREYPFIDPESGHLDNTAYPEDSDSLDKRIDKTISEIITKYRTNILLISHGSPIKSIFKTLVGYNSEKYSSMCSVSLFHYKSGNWKLEIHDDSRHLSTPDTTGTAFYKERWADLAKSREL